MQRSILPAAGRARSARSPDESLKAKSGKAIAFSTKTCLQAAASAEARFRNCFLAGKPSNKARSSTVVPREPRHGSTAGSLPGPQRKRQAASSLVALVMISSPTAAMEARASPRKPRVDRRRRSSASAIFEVAWGRAQSSRSARPMPEPSSRTRMSSAPPPSSSTATERAPESMALSRSSRRAAAGRSMTSPAAMRLAVSGGSTRIRASSMGMRIQRAAP